MEGACSDELEVWNKDQGASTQTEKLDDRVESIAEVGLRRLRRGSGDIDHDKAAKRKQRTAIVISGREENPAKGTQPEGHVESRAGEIVAVPLWLEVGQMKGREGQDTMHEKLV